MSRCFVPARFVVVAAAFVLRARNGRRRLTVAPKSERCFVNRTGTEVGKRRRNPTGGGTPDIGNTPPRDVPKSAPGGDEGREIISPSLRAALPT